ncbi:hypothetical protein HA49_00765 [Tatumella morbirosei]|uniref:Probable fimbrial chaperone EcpB n=1 Tax=Tatumella morbirosei TaxID=642227 RepID=A0A095VZU4_9GAMM|nr:hypothetical protein [Tatumella morbirosei]KGD80235.1 hypothetical protein HA49_00765 [Tatumella morbirosei]
MKYPIFCFSLLFAAIPCCRALDVGDITTFIYSDQKSIGKEITNSTDNGRLITLRIEKLSSPLADGKIINPQGRTQQEVLMTPASILLPAKSKELIRFFYQGPADNQERYYRINWKDQSVSQAPQEKAVREAIATSSAQIGTLLVVAPRKIHYAYLYQNGKLSNTGNATLRVVAYGPCAKAADRSSCRENYYLIPGRNRTFSQVNVADKRARIGMWQAGKFVAVK